MPELPAKSALRDELARLLAADLETALRAQQATREAATHEEARPENDKDTRALEQSYLARGQAMRVEELRAGLAEVKGMPLRRAGEGPAALGAVILADEGDQQVHFFLAPHGGGCKLADGAVLVVTPKSPLGRALIGKRPGDACEVVLAGRTRELEIVDVA